MRPARILVMVLMLSALGSLPHPVHAEPAGSSPGRVLVARYCVTCHNGEQKEGGLDLDGIASAEVGRHPEPWERVVRKLRARQMPPSDAPQPREEEYNAALTDLEGTLDRLAASHPHPGRTDSLRRLNRAEYQNAVRDLLALDVDVAALLPSDESSHGFDAAAVGDLSPALLERYISAAQKISALAVGSARLTADTYRVRADTTQESHVEGLPLGTRGGVLIGYHFPQDGDYEVQVRLARDRNEEVEGLTEPHELEILLNRGRVAGFTVAPPKDSNHAAVDEKLKARIRVPAGPHQLGVTFVAQGASLLETKRQPYQARYNMHRHPRRAPAIFQVSITGPYEPQGPGDTPSRRRIFTCRPSATDRAESCAKRILQSLVRRAYRRPVTEEDLAGPLALFREAGGDADFDGGMEMAISAVLVSPHFLFRIERDPPEIPAGRPYRISDLELATRLSFFLWSSLPDDELLDLAEKGQLSKPDVLARQVERMLQDRRSQSLATQFASQWLHLRNLDSITPDLRLFPDFDDNLRQALRRETELLFESVLREDRSVLDLVMCSHTFLNERLAKHYGIPHIHGSRYRRVDVQDRDHRGGLLRQGSILTVTSYATRTSPVIRGKWVLENLIGTPPPPPLPDVPALKDNTVSASLSVRQRLAEHRANEACASCHNLMDPTGFALENFDAIGRWRTVDEAGAIDASGGLPDGSTFSGVKGLEEALLSRPELFVGTLSEKLLAYALGRGIEPYDGPAVRQVVRSAKAQDYRFSSLIAAVVASPPFQMRKSE